MPKRTDIQTIMVIGSGPIIIGQAAEFDYAGTQACLALREEGYRVILVNSNPATIMTDKEIADVVYIEPLTTDFLSRIIRKEQPDALLPTLGGQVGLNMAVELDRLGVLEENSVELLGTKLDSIKQAEDRDLFRTLMNQMEIPVPESDIINTIEQAYDFAGRWAIRSSSVRHSRWAAQAGAYATTKMTSGNRCKRIEIFAGQPMPGRKVHSRLQGNRI